MFVVWNSSCEIKRLESSNKTVFPIQIVDNSSVHEGECASVMQPVLRIYHVHRFIFF